MSGSISVDFVGHQFSETAEIVLADIKISVKAGELVSLVGRSGCGKSTLLHIISGLLAPASGCVRIDGKTVTKPSAKWNMMFQKASLFWMSVQENVGLGLKFAGASKGQIAQKLMSFWSWLVLKRKPRTAVKVCQVGSSKGSRWRGLWRHLLVSYFLMSRFQHSIPLHAARFSKT